MIIKKEIDVAKETDEVMTLLVEVLKVIKKKEDWTSLMDELMTAISGIEDIADEADDMRVLLNTVCGRSGDIASVFMAKK